MCELSNHPAYVSTQRLHSHRSFVASNEDTRSANEGGNRLSLSMVSVGATGSGCVSVVGAGGSGAGVDGSYVTNRFSETHENVRVTFKYTFTGAGTALTVVAGTGTAVAAARG